MCKDIYEKRKEVSEEIRDKALKKLAKCKTCIKPKENGGCSGYLGLGCIGDWRCCLEMDAVCKDECMKLKKLIEGD